MMSLVQKICRKPPLTLLVTLALSAPSPVASQSLEGTGLVATGLLLRQLDGVKRVLMIAAHPDDEDTSLLATLARSWGAETAYLSLTRGDGGQNLIGPELWEGLGIVRTGELLSARELDGGRQFFTRAFDYGFSKSAEEALSLWPREELLGDVVWVVRRYRPHVIVSVFSGTPADGHGQHQAAGIMAREAFAAAGDPARFPYQLELGVETWTPSKLYQSSRRRFFSNGEDGDDGSLAVETGDHDPLLGRSPLQVAMESRSQHRSQDMGAAQPAGPRETGVLLVESRVDAADEGIFSGIDTTLVGLTDRLSSEAAAEAQPHLQAYRAAVHRAIEELGLDPAEIAPDLMRAREHLTAARAAAGDGADREYTEAIERKLEKAGRAVMAAAAVSFEVRAHDDMIVPGQTVEVTAELWNGGDFTLTAPESLIAVPEGWLVTERAVDGLIGGTLRPGALATWTYDVRLAPDAEPSKLYHLREPRDGARYRWPEEPSLWGLPRDPAPVRGVARFGLDSAGEARPDPGPTGYEASAPWSYVGVDPAFGEFTRPVLIVPAVSVAVAPSGITWPHDRREPQSISVVVRSEENGGSGGTVTVSEPTGWTVTPSSSRFDLDGAGVESVLTFDLLPSPSVDERRYAFRAVATTDDGATYGEGYTIIDYPHIDRAALFAPAELAVSVVDVAVAAGLRVGYVMGSGDDGPEALRQMGAEVVMLDAGAIRDGAFDGLSTIVLGVRAYETRPELQAAADRVLDFARAGGTVIAQYNRGPLGRLAPYPLEVGRGSPRVADETAPVRILEPDAPVFTTPNRIAAPDFEGWVQERGLYFASEWDDRYVPLMELNDPGEEPRRGALLATSVGEGVFVYTGLSFFRQWDGQVPGAYRLFANLVSLDADEWSALFEVP